MPINEDLQDSAIRHSILMTRVATGVTQDMLRLLNKSEERLFKTMRRLDPDDVATPFKRARIRRMIETIQDQQDQIRRVFKSDLKGETNSISNNERLFTKRQLREAAGNSFAKGFDFVSPARVHAAATSKPFQSAQLPWATQGAHVDELFRRRMRSVEAEILSGFVEGATTPEIIRRIRGTRALNFRDGIMEISRRGAETLTRTAVNHAANEARETVYEANDDLIKGVRYVAILDGRTTPVCMGLDGKIFPIRKGPRPPQHPNCRSTTVEILKGEKTPEYKSYNDWLKTQPKGFVEEVLGKKKAKLYLDGGVTLDRFIDKKGQTLTLDQLRVKENEAWKAVGLDRTGTPPTPPTPKPKPKPKPKPPPKPKVTKFAPAKTVEEAVAKQSALGISPVEPGVKVFKGFRQTTKVKRDRLRVLNDVNAEAQRMLDLAEQAGRTSGPLYQNMHFVANTANGGRAHIGWRSTEAGAERKGTLMQVAGAWETSKSNAKQNMLTYGVRNNTKRRWDVWDFEENMNRVTFRHELGHILTYRGAEKKMGEILKKLNWDVDAVRDNVSQYAGTNLWEVIAEVFAMVHQPTYKRGTLPKALEDFADEQLRIG